MITCSTRGFLILAALSVGCGTSKPPEAPEFQPCCMVTEIMAHAVGNDADREWFKVKNVSADPVDLEGMVVEGDDGGTVTVADPLPVPPGAFVVLGPQGDPTVNGGVTVDYVYDRDELGPMDSSNFSLRLTLDGHLIDMVGYDDELFLQDGRSYTLDPGAAGPADNDDRGWWCPSQTAYLLGELYGTPGGPNESCPGAGPSDPAATLTDDAPGAGDLIITELYLNSGGKSENDVNCWFELENVSDRTLNLQGVRMVDADGTGMVVSGGLRVARGARIVFAPTGNEVLDDAGIEVAYRYDLDSLRIHDIQDELVVLAGEVEVDRVSWRAGGVWPVVDSYTVAWQLDPRQMGAAANDQPAAWCPATAQYRVGWRGTPGGKNSRCDK